MIEKDKGVNKRAIIECLVMRASVVYRQESRFYMRVYGEWIGVWKKAIMCVRACVCKNKKMKKARMCVWACVYRNRKRKNKV